MRIFILAQLRVCADSRAPVFVSGRLEQKSQFSEGKERQRDSGKSVTSFVLGWGRWNVPKHFGLPSSLPDEQGPCRAVGEGIHTSWCLFQDLVKGLRVNLSNSWASQVAQMVKNLPAKRETWVQVLGREDPLEEGMATHSRILAWRIPRTEGPMGRQSRGLQRVGHS